MFPSLEQLHVCFNLLKSIHSPGSQLQHLVLLNLESNRLESWEQILHLDVCPRYCIMCVFSFLKRMLNFFERYEYM